MLFRSCAGDVSLCRLAPPTAAQTNTNRSHLDLLQPGYSTQISEFCFGGDGNYNLTFEVSSPMGPLDALLLFRCE